MGRRTTRRATNAGVTSSTWPGSAGVGSGWWTERRDRVGSARSHSTETSVSAGRVGTSRPPPCGFSRSGKCARARRTRMRSGLLSAMGIVPVADGVRHHPAPPFTFGPGPTARDRHRSRPRSNGGRLTTLGGVNEPLGAGALRALAAPRDATKRSLGQHFLIDPNLARAIATDVGVGPGDRVVEIGAGLGSLTRALAETGADVVAIEVDDALLPALEVVRVWVESRPPRAGGRDRHMRGPSRSTATAGSWPRTSRTTSPRTCSWRSWRRPPWSGGWS